MKQSFTTCVVSRLLVPCFAITWGCAAAGPDAGQTVPVPTPPTQQQDRIGIYHWGPDFFSWPGAPDKLNWGANYLAKFGARTLRIALTTRDEYGVNGGATDLLSIVQRPAYQTLLADARFTTYFLTVYTQDDQNSTWSDGYGSAEQSAERTAISQLGSYLLTTYAGKNFILLNWEGDNALSQFGGSETAWRGYVDWIKSRVDGVIDARNAVPSSTSSLYSGLEFNALKRVDSGAPCDANANKCVISYVGPLVNVDYYSYSSWQSLGTDTSTAGIGARLTADLDSAYGVVVAARPALLHANFMLGEFGAARDITGECDAAAREREVILALESWGASYGVAWQGLDNDPTNGIYEGFGRYKRDLSLSLAGQTFQNLYTSQTPLVPPAQCGVINAGGVVNSSSFNSQIHPGNGIAIFGGGFSSTGNTVWLKQGSTFTSITAGSANWFESPRQINATLPPGIIAGSSVNVYVRNAAGLDSNGQLITVLP